MDTAPSPSRDKPATSSQRAHDRLLDELEAALAEQKAHLTRGAPSDLDGAGDRVGELLAGVGAVADRLSPSCRARLERIRRDHLAVCLAIAADKQEVADRLARLRVGKRPLRAYLGD